MSAPVFRLVPHVILLLTGFGLTGPAAAQLTAVGAVLLDECATPGDCLPGDIFGSALASGDFDNDGFDDLAVGVPGKTVGGDGAAGSVHIYYGSAAGLTATGEQIFDARARPIFPGPLNRSTGSAAVSRSAISTSTASTTS